MVRYLTLIVAITFASGCLRDRRATDDPLHPATARASQPSSKPAPASPASRLSNPDDLRVVPPLIEEPAKLDESKSQPERRDFTDKPAMPSPFAPKPPKVEATPNVEAAPRAEKPSDLASIRKLYETASKQFDKLVDFEARLVRKEIVGKVENPAEEVLFQYRKKPFSIYMKTTGEHGKGREVLYVDGQNDGKMFVVIGEGDGSLFAKTGTKMAFAPTNPLVTGKSRHKITEAGFGDSLAKFGKVIALTENGTRPHGVKALGPVTRKEYPYPLEGVEIALHTGDDATLPKGGKKFVYFDMKEGSASYGFPVLVITNDENGREVEYYCFDKFKNPANLKDSDFSPDRLQDRPAGKRK